MTSKKTKEQTIIQQKSKDNINLMKQTITLINQQLFSQKTKQMNRYQHIKIWPLEIIYK